MTRARTPGPTDWQAPDVPALRGLAPGRSAWAGDLTHPRRLVVSLLAFPLALWGLRTALPPAVEVTTAWWLLLGAAAVLAAITVASYVPLPGSAGRGGASPCAAAAGVFLVLAALALGTASATALSGIPALALTGMALGQRLLGASACAPRS